MSYNVITFGFSSQIGSSIVDEVSKKFQLKISYDDFNKNNSVSLSKLISNINSFEFKKHCESGYEIFYKEYFKRFHVLALTRGLHFKDFYEIENEFYIYYNYFTQQLVDKKINLVIFANIPHQGPDYILYQLAKKKKIKTIIFYQSIFYKKYFQIIDLDDFGKFEKSPDNFEDYDLKDYYAELYEKMLIRYFKKNKKKRSLRYYFRKAFIFFKIINRKDDNLEYLRKLSQNSYELDEIRKISSEYNIFFIALNEQPELTTTMLGKNFLNQIKAIEKISYLLKNKIYDNKKWKIIVKDHYRQTSYMRGELFFKRLLNLENVILAKTSIKSFNLIDISKITGTVSGSIAWECLKLGKKACYFGKPWYSFFKNLKNINPETKYEEIKDFLNKPFDKDLNDLDLSFIKRKTYHGDVDQFYTIGENYDYFKNAKEIVKNLDKLINNNNISW